ncbi:MAG: helix-turn-helix transcriptional regulator [Planctomycetota bacterium]|jgi:excisionase family DNA binding protein
MCERLLRLNEVAERLGISRRQFYRLRPQLIAKGLQEVKIGHRRRYREASLDVLIRKAAETGRGL